MNLATLTTQLEEETGLDLKTLGPDALTRAIQIRRRECLLSSEEAYLEFLGAEADEIHELIGAMVVPETWFFRGEPLFSFLVGQISDRLRDRPANQPVRILSVPCSTGEEPYSLVLALLSSGSSPHRWVVEGVDLSAQHIEAARRGRYGKMSFRQCEPTIRERYFREQRERWELDASVRALVHFRVGNVIDPFFLIGEAPFDIILCRNLIIYLHAQARQVMFERLEQLLAPRGLLCVGSAEPLNLPVGRYQRVGPPACFAFERAVAPVPSSTPLPRPAPPRRPSSEPWRPQAASPTVATLPPLPTTPLAPGGNTLPLAQKQADEGLLLDALATCTAEVARKPSADLYYLMGVIYQAQQNPREAMACFRKVLYLQPDHRDALVHLMLLSEDQGEATQAAHLRRRLEQLPSGENL